MFEMILVFIVIIAIGLVAAWFLRGYLTGNSGTSGMFGGSREKRLGVVESATVDGRRKLVLIQRDGVEHLIMTGGPIDVVVESGIQPQRRQQSVQQFERYPQQANSEAAHESAAQPAFGRARVAAGSRPIEP